MKNQTTDTFDTRVMPVQFTITEAGAAYVRNLRAARNEEEQEEPDFTEAVSLPSIANGGSRFADL